jgi:purine-binding chemotaxis protein CheW
MKAVIFSLGDKEYGADLSEVIEVVRLRTITCIPDTPVCVEGVISLRGKVIPLVNMAVKLGLNKLLPVKSSRIIVVRVDAQMVGVLVDKVAGVVSLDPGQLTSPDEILKTSAYLTGIAKIGERIVLLLNFSKFLHDDMNSQIQMIRDQVEIREKK